MDGIVERHSPGLDELERNARHDLARLNYPPANWVPARTGPDGQPVLDVLIVGAGMCGQTVGWGLLREGIRNIRVIERNTHGHEGPWNTTARMPILRSPKHLTGPDLGVPSLTFRAWYEAQHGAEGWEKLYKIPRLDWLSYLLWVRKVVDLKVENGVSLLKVEGAGDFLQASLSTGETVLARKIVLANGRDGSGGFRWPSFPSFEPADLARALRERSPHLPGDLGCQRVAARDEVIDRPTQDLDAAVHQRVAPRSASGGGALERAGHHRLVRQRALHENPTVDRGDRALHCHRLAARFAASVTGDIGFPQHHRLELHFVEPRLDDIANAHDPDQPAALDHGHVAEAMPGHFRHDALDRIVRSAGAHAPGHQVAHVAVRGENRRPVVRESLDQIALGENSGDRHPVLAHDQCAHALERKAMDSGGDGRVGPNGDDLVALVGDDLLNSHSGLPVQLRRRPAGARRRPHLQLCAEHAARQGETCGGRGRYSPPPRL